MQPKEIDRLQDLLAAIETRAQNGLDGNGRRRWSEDHLRTILGEIRDLAQRRSSDEEGA